MERWSDDFADRVREWCNQVGGLAADALIDARAISKADFEKTSAVIGEEIFVRLCLHDYPPAPEAVIERQRLWEKVVAKQGLADTGRPQEGES